ncbi:UNVERIFIED_CONTAM: hypothetical protein Sradi_0272400 [Sesamum radiatum]|uniref:Uncharacterized protein n=1 Tax=Sesamum radiatum TaxID=300843 RepID=A0AAW2W6A3_SESRA
MLGRRSSAGAGQVVSVSKCGASSSTLNEPRRKSCDVVSGRSLSNLFDADDVGVDPKVRRRSNRRMWGCRESLTL